MTPLRLILLVFSAGLLVVSVATAQQVILQGTVRDFNDTHPDFESYLGTDPGIVEPLLGGDDLPVYAGLSGNPSTHGQESFDQWYRDTPGVNLSTIFAITLTPTGTPNEVGYDNGAFFPIDGQLFGNQGRSHNYHFTYEIHAEFPYNGGEVYPVELCVTDNAGLTECCRPDPPEAVDSEPTSWGALKTLFR